MIIFPIMIIIFLFDVFGTFLNIWLMDFVWAFLYSCFVYIGPSNFGWLYLQIFISWRCGWYGWDWIFFYKDMGLFFIWLLPLLGDAKSHLIVASLDWYFGGSLFGRMNVVEKGFLYGWIFSFLVAFLQVFKHKMECLQLLLLRIFSCNL